MNLVDIGLRWLDRKLNPEWSKKFIWALLAVGILLVSSPIIGSVIDISLCHGELEFNIAFSERTNSLWDALAPFIGVLFVISSVFLFRKKHTQSVENKEELIDTIFEGSLTFVDMNDPNSHKLYFKDKRIINIKFYNPHYNYKHKQILISGGSDCIWSEFIGKFPKIIQPYIIEIRKEIERTGLIKLTGQEMNNTIFEFEDGVTFGFTWRAWGEMVQSVGYQRVGRWQN